MKTTKMKIKNLTNPNAVEVKSLPELSPILSAFVSSRCGGERIVLIDQAYDDIYICALNVKENTWVAVQAFPVYEFMEALYKMFVNDLQEELDKTYKRTSALHSEVFSSLSPYLTKVTLKNWYDLPF